jgi:ubiquinone/menaquinone biosynthesis C-methylase UbiE
MLDARRRCLGSSPFTFHRLTSSRLPGLLSTLPFPLAAVVLKAGALAWLPAGVYSTNSLARSQIGGTLLLSIGAAFGYGAILFLIYWFATLVVWLWRHEFQIRRNRVGLAIVASIYYLAIGFSVLGELTGIMPTATLFSSSSFAWICLGAVALLELWALLHPTKNPAWADRPQALARLQSPFTSSSLQVESVLEGEELVSSTGEHFPIRHGIPDFRAPQDLTGDNLKYNHVYQTIGGFYDDIQRIFCVLAGFDRNAYFHSYMDLLEVKPGDSVLETSVGTGLNFCYLPAGVTLCGLDLSPEMLANCQLNLRRWQMDADLYLGNAESLPFADSSFDVVFHVGGINFFNDRAKAIHEMIRVAKPGSLLLIADETEKHVKEVYEKSPGGLWKNRKTAVSAPIDLVPLEMQNVHLQQMRNGDTYALTFRKPATA